MKHDILALVDDYCAQTGLAPSTVCLRATGNSRLYDRLTARNEYEAEQAGKLRAWIEANPPAEADQDRGAA